MIKEVFGKAVCRCSKCAHVTIEDMHKLPELCRNRQCRTRKWNDDAQAVEKNKPFSLADTVEEIYKTDKQLQAVTGKSDYPRTPALDAFQASLCKPHGIYKPLCKICQQST